MKEESKTIAINLGFSYGKEWMLQEVITVTEDFTMAKIQKSKYQVYRRPSGNPNNEWIWVSSFACGADAIKFLNEEMGNNRTEIGGEVTSYNTSI